MASSKTKGGIGAAIALLIASIFAVEGGFVDNPADPGGATNHGVTERVARADGYTGDMRMLPKARATDIIKRNYIVKPGYLPLVAADVHVAHEVIDSGYNAGPSRSTRWLQESLNHLNNRGRDYRDIAEDGLMGPGTMAAVEALQRRRGKALACQLLVKLMDAKQAQHYARLAAANDKFETFMVGWVRTRIGNVDWSQC